MNKILKIVIVALILCGGIVTGVFISQKMNSREPVNGSLELDEDTQDWTGNQKTYSGEAREESIDIPGFDAMNLKAGESVQSVNLYNPEENQCYFRISIVLDDGVLWQSGLISPGKGLYEIELNSVLEEGSYPAVLKYECFSMNEEKTPLNGAELSIQLNVLK